MDSFFTVVTGVSVLVIGQFIVKAFIDPSRELAKSIGEISYALIFYANVYTSPGISTSGIDLKDDDAWVKQKSRELEDVQVALRKLASDLIARQHAIPLYCLWGWLRFVPGRSNILSASRNLILISNNMFNSGNSSDEENKQARRDIETALRLKLGFGT